jgi:hypothetical protein
MEIRDKKARENGLIPFLLLLFNNLLASYYNGKSKK